MERFVANLTKRLRKTLSPFHGLKVVVDGRGGSSFCIQTASAILKIHRRHAHKAQAEAPSNRLRTLHSPALGLAGTVTETHS